MSPSSKARVRQPKQERAQQTINAILEAATQVLLREGYERASTNRIAHRAGVSVGSLYQYFRNKDAVFTALLDLHATGYPEAMQRIRPTRERPLEDWLLDLTSHALRVVPHGPEIYRQLERVPHGALRSRAIAARQAIVALVRAELELHRDELIVGDLDLAAQLVVAASEGIAVNADPALDVGEARWLQELCAMLVRYLTGTSDRTPAASPQ
jgi:AcrR family transcriptional regulator